MLDFLYKKMTDNMLCIFYNRSNMYELILLCKT